MSEKQNRVDSAIIDTGNKQEKSGKGSSRRKFLGQVGVAAGLAAGAIAAPVVAAAQENSFGTNNVSAPGNISNLRVREAFQLRVRTAMEDALLPPVKNVNNGDDALYPDKGGTYTKGLAHDQYGRVTPSSYQSFKQALHSGKFSAFEEILVG